MRTSRHRKTRQNWSQPENIVLQTSPLWMHYYAIFVPARLRFRLQGKCKLSTHLPLTVFIKKYVADPMLITKLTRSSLWYQQYNDIWSEIGKCILQCTHIDCRYANHRRRHPWWKRFPLRALFPMLKLGRPTATEYRIQQKLREYVQKLMIPAEDSDKAETSLQMDKVLDNNSGVPCSRCWTRNDPGYTRFWTYLFGDRVLPNPKSVLEQLTNEFGKTKTTKQERARRVHEELTQMIDEKFTSPTTIQSNTVVGFDPISPPNSGFSTIAEKYYTEDKSRALWTITE